MSVDKFLTAVKGRLAASTPGPWHVRTIDESIGSIDNANGEAVAQAFEMAPRPNHELRRATTALIASAPTDLRLATEMLTVMREALERIADETSEHPLAFKSPSNAANIATEANETCDRLAERG